MGGDQFDQSPTGGGNRVRKETSESIDWYHPGDARVVDVDGVQVEIRYVGRDGRKCRIAITAPPGATFRSSRDR